MIKRRLLILLIGAAMGAFSTTIAGDDVAHRPVVEAAVQEATVQGGVGQIVVSAGDSEATFAVYSITGRLLRTVKVPAGQRCTLDMPKGFYIVRCGSRWSRKVVVR